MKKLLIASGLILIMLCGALLNIRYLESFIGDLLCQVDATKDLVDAGDFSAAQAQLQQAFDDWNQADSYTHVFIRHAEIDSTTDAFCEMLGSLHAQDAGQTVGSYEKLRAHLTSIAQMERVTFGSIF